MNKDTVKAADDTYEIYVAFRAAGFEKAQAFELTKILMSHAKFQ